MKKIYSNTLYHRAWVDPVMLVEIPDPWVILGVVAAFFAGLGGPYLFYRLRPHVRMGDAGPMQAEKLEYYERQLIDMKIRLDALELQRAEEKEPQDPDLDLRQFLEKLVKNAAKERPVEQKGLEQPERVPEAAPEVQRPAATPSFGHASAVEQVLHLITDRAMTSRDIQITLKRSREHTSRLMKKLFEDGYVERTQTKPYTYQITQKGREKISKVELPSTTAA